MSTQFRTNPPLQRGPSSWRRSPRALGPPAAPKPGAVTPQRGRDSSAGAPRQPPGPLPPGPLEVSSALVSPRLQPPSRERGDAARAALTDLRRQPAAAQPLPAGSPPPPPRESGRGQDGGHGGAAGNLGTPSRDPRPRHRASERAEAPGPRQGNSSSASPAPSRARSRTAPGRGHRREAPPRPRAPAPRRPRPCSPARLPARLRQHGRPRASPSPVLVHKRFARF